MVVHLWISCEARICEVLGHGQWEFRGNSGQGSVWSDQSPTKDEAVAGHYSLGLLGLVLVGYFWRACRESGRHRSLVLCSVLWLCGQNVMRELDAAECAHQKGRIMFD